MRYDFDTTLDRRHTHSLKWDRCRDAFGVDDVIPMWVADMDFAAPPAVVEAVERRAAHGAYGYVSVPESFWQSAIDWLDRRHGWKVERPWLHRAPGVVPALSLCVNAFTEPGDGVVVQTPVYYPFFHAIERNDRRLVRNPLVADSGTFRMDLALPGHAHQPLAAISPDLAARTVTCVAPSKTFNLAGLSMSLIVASNPELLARYERQFDASGLEIASLFGTVALEVAYRTGDDWLDQLRDYLAGNLEYLDQFIREHLPALRLVRPEGTYLALIDCRGLGMPQKELDEFFLKEARVYFDSGVWFGKEAAGHVRMNFACPRATLAEALRRIERAVASRR